MNDKNKPLTAIEWLESQLYFYGLNPNVELFKQAKQMFKQQIRDAYEKAHEDGYHFEGSVADYLKEGLEKHLSEHYYTEIFNSK
jgi:hypothetical protein